MPLDQVALFWGRLLPLAVARPDLVAPAIRLIQPILLVPQRRPILRIREAPILPLGHQLIRKHPVIRRPLVCRQKVAYPTVWTGQGDNQVTDYRACQAPSRLLCRSQPGLIVYRRCYLYRSYC